MNLSGPLAAKAARGAIVKLFGGKWGRDGADALPPALPATVMLTQDERDTALSWRARAA